MNKKLIFYEEMEEISRLSLGALRKLASILLLTLFMSSQFLGCKSKKINYVLPDGAVISENYEDFKSNVEKYVFPLFFELDKLWMEDRNENWGYEGLYSIYSDIMHSSDNKDELAKFFKVVSDNNVTFIGELGHTSKGNDLLFYLFVANSIQSIPFDKVFMEIVGGVPDSEIKYFNENFDAMRLFINTIIYTNKIYGEDYSFEEMKEKYRQLYIRTRGKHLRCAIYYMIEELARRKIPVGKSHNQEEYKQGIINKENKDKYNALKFLVENNIRFSSDLKKYLIENPEHKVAVLCGAGHVIRGYPWSFDTLLPNFKTLSINVMSIPDINSFNLPSAHGSVGLPRMFFFAEKNKNPEDVKHTADYSFYVDRYYFAPWDQH
ncbi:hypothetical protein ACFL56_00600 [Candidatus Margulisiibacteriota bacterium]